MLRPRRCFALLFCIAALLFSLAHAGIAAAESAPDPSTADQTSSNSSSASASNDSSTSQTSTDVQTSGGSSGGQSQSAVQSASTDQGAGASATSNQAPANVGAGSTKTQQSNSGAASSTATNGNVAQQQSSQSQAAGTSHPDSPAAGSGASQTTEQSAPTKQTSVSTATSSQVAPTNVNVVIRIDSPGNEGPVTQTNSSTAVASSGNTNEVVQSGQQTQVGGGAGAGQTQQAAQSAPTTQQATAGATSAQVDPLNLNIVVRNKSPGDQAPVSQTNTSMATAVAANASGVTQGSSQVQNGGGSAGGQSQLVSQSAPTSQAAAATATSTQVASTNAGISISVDPDGLDPNGSGARGTLIQIWIPRAPGGTAGGQPNASVANATATNTNAVTQSADQVQTAGGTDSTHLGGSGQIQVVHQSAPTNQTATATATATAPQGTSSSGVETSSREVSQVAEQSQSGGGGQVQVVEQSSDGGDFGHALTGAVGTSAGDTGGWRLAAPALTLFTPRSIAWAAGRPGAGGAGPRHAPARHRSTPEIPQLPLPSQAPMTLGAAAGGTSGGSLWLFGSLLIPFLLTAPWWARLQRPSAVRRLMGVVSRLERPG